MQTSLKFSKSFWTRRFIAEFELSISTERNLIPIIATALIQILQENLISKGTKNRLENFQGILEPASGISRLFALRGLINLETPPLHYEISLETGFKEYVGNHTTVYEIKEFRVNIPQTIPLEFTTKMPGLTPHELVFSIEHLRSRAFIPLLGYFPNAEERFTLACTPSSLSIFIHAENLAKKELLPFYDHPLLEKISESIEKVIRISVIQEYQKKIQ